MLYDEQLGHHFLLFIYAPDKLRIVDHTIKRYAIVNFQKLTIRDGKAVVEGVNNAEDYIFDMVEETNYWQFTQIIRR